MTEAWRAIDWDEIDTGYTYGTHADDSGLVKDQLKAALFSEYEKVLQMHHERVQNAGTQGTIAAAASMDPGGEDEDYLRVTGGPFSIATFSAADTGTKRTLEFQAANTLVHSAGLVLPGDVNMAVVDGDIVTFRCFDGTNWVCTGIRRNDGMPQGRRGVADGSADEGVLDIDSDNALATAGDLLYRGANNASPRWGIDFDGHEWLSNAGNGGVGTLERVLRNYARSELISTYDFYGGVDITIDGFWHHKTSGGGGSDERLDCSSFIPSGSRIVTISIQWRSTIEGQYITLTGEEDPQTNVTYNRVITTNPKANGYGYEIGTITLPDDDSRKLSYFAQGQGDNARVTILKWGK